MFWPYFYENYTLKMYLAWKKMRKFSVWSIKNHRSAAVKVACAVCAPPGSARETGLKSSRVFCINNKNNNRFTRQDHCIIQSQKPNAYVTNSHGELLWSVVVRRPSSCVVRRPSSVNIWCLHSRDHICDQILMKLDQNVCFNNI